MARRKQGPPPALQPLLDTERRQLAEPRPQYLTAQQQFRERLFLALPALADRINAFLMAPVERVMTANGQVVQLVDERYALHESQVALIKTLLTKAIPNLAPIDSDGKDVRPEGAKHVHISINQVGETVDFNQLPGQIVGVVTGQARKTGTLSFNRPTEADLAPAAVTIDVEPEPQDER